jgi:hypothetical protein
MRRSRATHAVLAIATVAVGLTVHGSGTMLGDPARDILGDALWAMMITWGLGMVIPYGPSLRRGAIALAICYIVEFSQLYRTPLLDAARNTRLGQLTLGSGFDARDLLAYACGVIAAMILERLLWGRVDPASGPKQGAAGA